MRRLARRAGRLAAWTAALCVLALVGFRTADRLWPFPVERLREQPESRELFDRHGRMLTARVGTDEQWRRPVPLSAMGPWMVPATIAVEDRRFREHRGIDPLAAIRATGQLVRHRRIVSGASTLTMQVCRMMEPRDRTFSTKAIESFRALQLESLHTKDEILDLYLNMAPYGGNVRGVESAAQHWFGKRTADLSLEEAALLAGLPQSPTRLRPDRHPEAARARRDFVLAHMHEMGVIDRRQFARACAAPLVLAGQKRRRAAPHVAEMAFTRRPGGGRTTIDLDVQHELERVVGEWRQDLAAGSDLAVVVIDIESAELLALLGSPDALDPHDGQVNGALSWRSPGSTLKPFVFAAAIESYRLDPAGVIEDSPIEVNGWAPQNFERGFDGTVSVAEALQRSLNIPSLRVAMRAGLHRCLGVMEACGISLPRGAAGQSGLALVTGATEVRLFDLTNAYATLGRGGVHRPVRLFPDEPAPAHRALSETTCEVLAEILSDARRSPFAWKTGTSSSHRDAWAVGQDGELAIGVWVGRFGGSGRVEYTGRRVAEPLLRRLFGSLPRLAPGRTRP